ncbi:MAG TPA: HNH endonuclease, partial [Euzebya sp.]|nr:HNH endonuclease [Euzebya sp.]
MTARILWRLAGGRTRLTGTSATRPACDATLIPLIVNGNHVPAAVGDAQSPITLHHRRAAAAADQGCRFPGCDAPAAWTDLHHVLWREHGGLTELANLVSLCRRCHTSVHQRGWQLTLHHDRTLPVSHGRWTFTSRPRLTPGPRAGPATPSPPARQPMSSQPGRPPPGRASPDRASPSRASPDRSPSRAPHRPS